MCSFQLLLEILPVAVQQGQVRYLRRTRGLDTPSWRMSASSGHHPTATATQAVITSYGAAIRPTALILVPLAWCFDGPATIVLPHLAVLPGGTWLTSWVRADAITMTAVDKHRTPLVAQALGQLAWLWQYDPAIRQALPRSWVPILRHCTAMPGSPAEVAV